MDRDEPELIAGLSGIASIAAGRYSTYALRNDGTVLAWGDTDMEDPGDITIMASTQPAPVPELTNVVSIAHHGRHAVAALADGRAVFWGQDVQYDRTGFTGSEYVWPPEVVPELNNAVLVAAGYEFILALTGNGQVMAWGSNAENQLGWNTPRYSLGFTPIGLTGLSQVDAGDTHVLALTTAGDVYSWGNNSDGRVGHGMGTEHTMPVRIPGLAAMQQVSAGTQHSLALDATGAVWAWGSGRYGRLGDGDTATHFVWEPQEVAGLTTVVQAVSAGGWHSLALDENGDVWSWGRNNSGQLGNGSNVDSGTPQSVDLPVPAVQIAAGERHSVALLEDGSVWSWGHRGYGAMGNGGGTGITGQEPSPIQTFISGVASIAAGSDNSMVTMEDGTVQSWGRNLSGVLGHASSIDRDTPTLITDLQDVDIAQVHIGKRHAIAVDGNGNLYGWGYGYQGTLGAAVDSSFVAPRQIANGTGVNLASAQSYMTIAVLDGAAHVTGTDVAGELGLGRLVWSVNPRLIEDLPRMAQPAAQ